MILKVFGVLQLILIQVISAQISARDLIIQNVLNNLEYTAGCSRSRRQINNPLEDLPGTGHLPVKEIANALSFQNDRSLGNFAQGNGSPNNLALNNGVPTSNMGLPSSSPVSSMLYPFPNTNMLPQNKLLPNGNNNNGLPINNIPNSLPIFNNLPNGLPAFDNVPNNVPDFNNVRNGRPLFNNIPNGMRRFDKIISRLPGITNIPSRFPSVNNIPNGLPILNNLPYGLPGLNNVPNGMRGFDSIPSGFPGISNIPNRLPVVNNIPNGLPSFNNLPNGLPSAHNLPNGLPNFNSVPNGLPALNNIPEGLPVVNNIPNGLPSFNNLPNGLPGLNDVPNGMRGFDNIPSVFPGVSNIPNRLPVVNSIPNGLPNFNNLPNRLPNFNSVPNGLPALNNIPEGLPGVNNIPNGLPSFNNLPNRLPNVNIMPNILPNQYNLPGTNKFQNLINVLAGNNILNSNNLQDANFLPNINNIPITNGLTNINNAPCGIAYPVPLENRLPQKNLPINNQLPLQGELQATEIGIENGFADVNRFPRNDQLNNMLSNANYFKNVNRLVQHGPPELTNINRFSVRSNTPITEVSNNAQAINMLPSVNNFPNINGVSNFAGKAENINMMPLNHGIGDVSNYLNYNMMPVNELKSVNNIPFNNGFAPANHIVANNVLENANNRLIYAITNGMPLSNGGYLNDILFANNAVNSQETPVHNIDGNVFSSNDVQLDNVQVPIDDWHFETVETELPSTQIVLPEGVHMVTNVPSEYQDGLMSNSLSLVKELVGNLKIEGVDSMPFLNGLPVAGITETVTVLNP